jgi:hypothetical protein
VTAEEEILIAPDPHQLRCPYCFNPMRGVDLLGHLQESHVSVQNFDPGPPIKLLNEWYRWWLTSDEAPAKMPQALHVRSALVLQSLGYDVTPKGL